MMLSENRITERRSKRQTSIHIAAESIKMACLIISTGTFPFSYNINVFSFREVDKIPCVWSERGQHYEIWMTLLQLEIYLYFAMPSRTQIYVRKCKFQWHVAEILLHDIRRYEHILHMYKTSLVNISLNILRKTSFFWEIREERAVNACVYA